MPPRSPLKQQERANHGPRALCRCTDRCLGEAGEEVSLRTLLGREMSFGLSSNAVSS